MADDKTTKATRGRGTALAEQLAQRAQGLSAAPAPTPAAGRPRPARERREAPAGTRRSMPAETPKPPPSYSARISHTTTPAQLQALEAVRSEAKAAGSGAVSVTALLRAAAALCLDDPRLRARWIKAARTEWR